MKIRIMDFNGIGAHFANLTEGSEHQVIDTPEGENNERGVWVQGVGMPVKVLHSEYEIIK